MVEIVWWDAAITVGASEALKGGQTVAELASQFGVCLTMIHSWNRALIEGASGVFERGGKKAPTHIKS